jgi:hypothetical protein
MRTLSILFASLLSASGSPVFAQQVVSDSEVVKGIGQVETGDYDAAIVTLDAAARRLAAEPAKARELSQAYLYLGIAYVAKGHEAAARAKFRDALAQVKDLSLSPEEFSPKVIDLFEAVREDSFRVAPERGARSGAPEGRAPSADVRADRDERAVTFTLESQTVPLELTVDPMVYHSVRVQVGPTEKGSVKITFVVNASNPGDQDHDAVVNLTVLGADGQTLLTKRASREIEEGEKKDLKFEIKLLESALEPGVTCRLEFAIS